MTSSVHAVMLAGVVPGQHTFNALLEAHAADGHVASARDVYETMKDHGIRADHCTFIALFQVSTRTVIWCLVQATTLHCSKLFFWLQQRLVQVNYISRVVPIAFVLATILVLYPKS